MSKFTRRQFLVTAGASAASAVLLNACGQSGDQQQASQTPAPAAGGAEAPEVTTATLGFIALTDASPLIVAQEKGFFAKHGMTDVKVQKQTSWAVTRDNLELGAERGGIDGAHILSPMPLLMTAGAITKSKQPAPMYTLARLNTQAQGITVAEQYLPLKVALKSDTLKPEIDKAKAAGKKFKGAVTFPGGTHDLWMRYWLAAGGIDPNADVDLVVIPPPQMVANLETKTMDMFCVGEPWNARAVQKKLGYSAVTTGEIWDQHPEKSFSMRAEWVDKHPKAAKALLMAVQEAQIWCNDPKNLPEMAEIVSKDKYIKAPVKDILPRLQGNFDFGDGRTLSDSPLRMQFWVNGASFPYKSHDTWFVTEDMRWGYLPANTDIKALVDKVNRADLWKEAATAIGQTAAIPASDSRGVETFFDGVKFDPANPQAYLDSLKIKALKA
jgi:nitrate/nitrite transport system substrate-binding protein